MIIGRVHIFPRGWAMIKKAYGSITPRQANIGRAYAGPRKLTRTRSMIRLRPPTLAETEAASREDGTGCLWAVVVGMALAAVATWAWGVL